MPSFWENLFGSGGEMVSTLDKNQQKMQDQYTKGIQSNPLYQQGNDFLMKLLSGDTSQFEQPLMQQFEQEIIPGIAERFAGMGTGAGAGSSSGLNNSLAKAGQNLTGQLGALKGNLQMQGLQGALQYAQQPFTNQLGGMNVNSQAYQPGSQGMMSGILSGLAGGVGSGFGMGMAGPMMNMFGAGNAPATGDTFQANNPWKR